MPFLVLDLVSSRVTAVGTKRICAAFCSHLWDNRTSAKAKKLKLIKQRMEAQLDTGNVPEILAWFGEFLFFEKKKIGVESKPVPRVPHVLYTLKELVPYICSLVNRVMCTTINNHSLSLGSVEFQNCILTPGDKLAVVQQAYNNCIVSKFLIIFS